MKKFITIMIPTIGLCFILYSVGTCSTPKRTKPCTQCPQYSEEIKELKKVIEENNLVLEQIEEDYYMVWEENQRFSSMLSQIENEPGGHEILQKLWNEQR